MKNLIGTRADDHEIEATGGIRGPWSVRSKDGMGANDVVRGLELEEALDGYDLRHHPHSGPLSPTNRPYQRAGTPAILDYFMSSAEAFRTSTVQVEGQAAFATSHNPIIIVAQQPEPTTKNIKQEWIRRKWPGLEEKTPGQLMALLHSEWTTLDQLHSTLPRAARASAAKSKGHRPPPFGTQEETLIRRRSATHDRGERQVWQKCVLEVQLLNPTKCEYMEAGDVANTCMRIWEDHEFAHYIATGFRPLDQYDPDAFEAHRRRQRRGRRVAEARTVAQEQKTDSVPRPPGAPTTSRPQTPQPRPAGSEEPRPTALPLQPATAEQTQESRPKHFAQVPSMIVLGSLVVPDRSQVRKTVDHRIARAWHAYSQIRPHLAQRGVPLHLRLQLLETVVKPTLLWGLETVNLPRL